jgi:hypothetical protein
MRKVHAISTRTKLTSVWATPPSFIIIFTLLVYIHKAEVFPAFQFVIINTNSYTLTDEARQLLACSKPFSSQS